PHLRDGGQPPVVVKPARLRAAVRTHAVAHPGRPAVRRREEGREGGPVRRRPTAAPGVGVVHTVDTRAGVVLLLPDEPGLVVSDRAVPVVHEAQGVVVVLVVTVVLVVDGLVVVVVLAGAVHNPAVQAPLQHWWFPVQVARFGLAL